MLKKEFRLRKQKDFENAFSGRICFSEKFLLLKAVKNDLDISRFGFVVSKRVSNKAAKRNRIKRLLRESIRLSQKSIKPGFDLVFVSRSAIADRNFQEICLCVEKLLKKSGLLKIN